MWDNGDNELGNEEEHKDAPRLCSKARQSADKMSMYTYRRVPRALLS